MLRILLGLISTQLRTTLTSRRNVHFKLMDSYSMNICGFLSGLQIMFVSKTRMDFYIVQGKLSYKTLNYEGFLFHSENPCEFPHANSLKGLSFNISVSSQRNKSECVPVQNIRNLKDCAKFYPFASFPNLLGGQEQEAIYTAGATFLLFKQIPGDCYKFLLEMLCYIFGPKCDVTRRVTIPPCRENCWDFVNGCLGLVQKIVHNSDLKTFLNCDYLPTVGSDIECFYKNCDL